MSNYSPAKYADPEPHAPDGDQNQPIVTLMIDDFRRHDSEYNWCTGDRVLARWLDLCWYPATILDILHVNEELEQYAYHVLYDDGDQLFIPEVAVLPLSSFIGERIVISPKTAPPGVYFPASIIGINGELLDVEYDEGGMERNLRISRARFWRCPVPVPEFSFQEGDRVFARTGDGFKYPGDIVEIIDDRVVVQTLLGHEMIVTAELVGEFSLNIGDAVDCRWKGGETFYPGRIAELVGQRVFIHYDDGEKEWTNIRLLRLPLAG
jgi:hypothetical protein